MNLIPAIDLKDNKCVRLTKGKDDTSIIFNDNPVEQAIYFEKNGCNRLHIVDLDAAFGRGNINDRSIIDIRNAINSDTRPYLLPACSSRLSIGCSSGSICHHN